MNALQRNHVKVLGWGKRVLLFGHGFGCDQTMWRQITPAFEADYRMVVFDHVGSGMSDTSEFSPARYGTLRGYALDVLEIIAEFGLKDVHFVGHSVSSMIGALAAIERPELFASLTMIGPSPCYLNDGAYRGGFERVDLDRMLGALGENHVVWSAEMAPLIVGAGASPMLIAELEACLCRMDPMLAHHFARVIFLSDLRAELLRLKVPTLILQCMQDLVVPPGIGEYMREAIVGSRLVGLNATGHCPHMSAPGEVIREVRAFLGEFAREWEAAARVAS